MDSGIVASRYASALLKYSVLTGTADKVYAQIKKLVRMAGGLPALKEAMLKYRELSPEKKILLAEAAVQEPLEDALVRVVKLAALQKRTELMLRIFLSFVRQYRRACNVKVCRLVTAVPIDGLAAKVGSLVTGKTGARVEMETKTDPLLMGGFVLEMDGYRLDASAAGRLRAIRHELLEDGNRIV